MKQFAQIVYKSVQRLWNVLKRCTIEYIELYLFNKEDGKQECAPEDCEKV